MSRRIGLATLTALLGLVVSVVAFGRAPGAIATQGQPIIAGQTNTATNGTVIQNTTESIPACSNFSSRGLTACGSTGLVAFGTEQGVYATGQIAVGGQGGIHGVHGSGSTAGVYGVSNTSNGSGVEGDSDGDGNGVFGHANNSFASGVYGQNLGTGYGVAGRANQGTGVLADSNNGTALTVNGKAQFSRSGTATVVGTAASPRSSVTVTNVALTLKSLVLVTPQKNGPGV